MSRSQSAIVIGAGIGGLTAAHALTSRGWEVTLLERASELRPVGYALVIAPNALRALDTIDGDIVTRIHALAAIQGDGGVRDASGAWLSHNDPAVAIERYGHPVVAIRRSALIEILSAGLAPGMLRLNSAVTEVAPATGTVTVHTGEVLRADLVVAADGIRSATRSALFPEHPVPTFAGLTTWQAVIPGDRITSHAGSCWGRGGEFGMLRLADGAAYLFAQAAAELPLVPRSGAEEKADLEQRYSDLYAPVQAAISLIDPEAILRADIYSLRTPLPAFHRGTVAILGDAAHPMAPSPGQGGCQAIEDAVTLAYCVSGTHSLPQGLAEYTTARLPRTSLIVRRSEQIARIATAGNPALRRLRNVLVRGMGLLGPSAALRQADFVMRWDHPAMAQRAEISR